MASQVPIFWFDTSIDPKKWGFIMPSSDNPNTMESGSRIGPTRASTFPEDAVGRKARPVATGVLNYFPDAIVALAEVSWAGNQQHHLDKPLHWDRSKSSDEDDACMRHFLQRGTLDTDGIRHTAKACWRLMAFLQKEIEAENDN